MKWSSRGDGTPTNWFSTSKHGHWSLFVRGKKKEDFEQFGGEFNFTVRPNKMRRRGPPAYLLAFKELVDLFRFWVDPVSDMFAEVKFKVF